YSFMTHPRISPLARSTMSDCNWFVRAEFSIRVFSLLFLTLIFWLGLLEQRPYWGWALLIIVSLYQAVKICFYVYGSVRWKRQNKKLIPVGEREPFVSILVPCFNEEKVIAQSLRSLLRLDYSRYEIIVIDDGSVDLTVSIA